MTLTGELVASLTLKLERHRLERVETVETRERLKPDSRY